MKAQYNHLSKRPWLAKSKIAAHYHESKAFDQKIETE